MRIDETQTVILPLSQVSTHNTANWTLITAAPILKRVPPAKKINGLERLSNNFTPFSTIFMQFDRASFFCYI